jgi:O-antigen/teichoic acid export membrane protein
MTSFTLMKKITLNLLTRGLSVSAILLLQIMLAKWLSSSDYGTFVLLQVICLGLATLAQAGMNNVYTKLVASQKTHQSITDLTKIVVNIMAKYTIVALLIYLCISLYLYSNEIVTNVIVLSSFLLSIPAQAFLLFIIGWYRARDLAHISSLIEQGGTACLMLLICFYSKIYEATNIDLAYCAITFCIASFIIALLSSINWFKHLLQANHQGRVHSELYIKTLSTHFLLAQLATYIATWSGVLVCGVFLSTNEAGELNFAQRISQIIVFFLAALNGVLAPRFAEMHATGRQRSLRALAQKSTKLLVATTLPVIVSIITLVEEVLPLFDLQFFLITHLLVVLMFGQTVNVFTGSVGLLLSMTGYENIQKNIVGFCSLLSIILVTFGTYYFGAIGAALAISITICIDNLVAAYYVYKKLGFWTIPMLQRL